MGPEPPRGLDRGAYRGWQRLVAAVGRAGVGLAIAPVHAFAFFFPCCAAPAVVGSRLVRSREACFLLTSKQMRPRTPGPRPRPAASGPILGLPGPGRRPPGPPTPALGPGPSRPRPPALGPGPRLRLQALGHQAPASREGVPGPQARPPAVMCPQRPPARAALRCSQRVFQRPSLPSPPRRACWPVSQPDSQLAGPQRPPEALPAASRSSTAPRRPSRATYRAARIRAGRLACPLERAVQTVLPALPSAGLTAGLLAPSLSSALAPPGAPPLSVCGALPRRICRRAS